MNFASSGRTSRREIRKLLRECLFWRFKRARSTRHGSKIHTHSFLFDEDDDDTERSNGTATGATPYCALTMHSQNRSNYVSRQNSTTNYPVRLTRKPSVLSCCGFAIDLSHKHSIYSSNLDLTSRRSTLCKSTMNTGNHNNTNNNNHFSHLHENSPRKFRTYSVSPRTSPFSDRNLRQQQRVSLQINEEGEYPVINRQRRSTVLRCKQRLASPTIASPSNNSTDCQIDSMFVRRSISEEQEFSPTNLSSPANTPDASPVLIGDQHSNEQHAENEDIRDAIESGENHLDEQTLPAYIIETC